MIIFTCTHRENPQNSQTPLSFPAGVSILSGLLLYLCPPFDPRKWKSSKKNSEDASSDAEESPLLTDTQTGANPDPAVVAQEHAIAEQTRLLGRTRYWLLISSATMYLLLYITLEATFGSYISAYAYKSGMGSLESSSYISSGLLCFNPICKLFFSPSCGCRATVFWGGFCLGRGLSVIISTKLSPRTMCFFGVISATLVMAALVTFKTVCQFFSHPFLHICSHQLTCHLLKQNALAMWIGVGGFGFYIGPLWASLWAYMGEYVEMSGTAGTVITIGSGFVLSLSSIKTFPCLFFFNSLVLTKPDWEASLRRLLWAR